MGKRPLLPALFVNHSKPGPKRVIFLPLIAIFLPSCGMKITEAAALPLSSPPATSLSWPKWKPAAVLKPQSTHEALFPRATRIGKSRVISYGPRPDGSEQILLISKRDHETTPGIHALQQCFLPTSLFAGPSPLQVYTNTLQTDDRKWVYPAHHFRSTFLDLHPALTPKAKGLLVYHTSIMLLSVAEKQVIDNFRQRGWNVLVGLPPDSLYRTRLPTVSSPEATLAKAAEIVAADMDHHYLEQARTTGIALDYLAKTRPSWLTGQRVLMGTSAGTFAMPAEALMNPGWDALIFVSGGTNLLSLYESGSAGLFQDTLGWIDEARASPPRKVRRIYSDQEYHEIFRRAATLTRFHSGALAPMIRDQRILMIAGTLDRIMPREQALGLHRALGSPERWTTPLGHHLIALQLILEVDRIDRWLDSKNSSIR